MEQNHNKTNITGRVPKEEPEYPRPSLSEPDGDMPRCGAYDGNGTSDTAPGGQDNLPSHPAPDGGNSARSNPEADDADSGSGNAGGEGGPGKPDNTGSGCAGGESPSGDGGMTGVGTLIFQVTAAEGAVPLEGAQVTVRDCLDNDAGSLSGDTVGVLFSGPDGRTPPLRLPAPARAWSLAERPAGSPLPYSVFNAEAELEGYYTQAFLRIPVFDGITSVQQINLIPLPLSGGPGPEQVQTVIEGAGETL